jgi:hypothetical protein
MKKKISLTVMLIVILLINLTLSVQVTHNNNQVSISFLESKADVNNEGSEPKPGGYPIPNSQTLDEWSLSSIMDYLLNL